MKTKRFLTTLVGFVMVVAVSAITTILIERKKASTPILGENLAVPTTFTCNDGKTPQNAIQTDFTYAAERSLHSVVHVKTKYKTVSPNYRGNSLFDYFFGNPYLMEPKKPQERMASGSGVIISSDGYIVTNNHVIENATEVEVTLNDKRTFKADVVGVDASTDIALLKISAESLPTLPLGDSDRLKVGEWVLAVGNPFNLTSTVTAGIVSAKARNINLLNSELKIESFIQTDAVVNPGNSGGALVNTNGELVGINTAIASHTGSYEGYSFAIPVSIVGKIVADLKEYGVVQRAILGVQIRDITNEIAKEKDLKNLKGAYVADVVEGSSASVGGIQKEDIIVSVNGIEVASSSQLQEQIGRYRPGDKVKIGYIRKNTPQEVIVELRNRSGNTNIIKAVDLSILGAKFTEVGETFRYKYKLNEGILVDSIEKNGKFEKAGIRKGFVVLKVNNREVSSVKDMENLLSIAQTTDNQYKVLFISGIYPDGKVVHYVVDLAD